MQFLSNLTKNQLIGIGGAIVLIIILAIVMYRRKQDYEEMKKEAMLEKGKVVVANFDENIKGKHMKGPPLFATIIPERLIDGPLYNMIKPNQNYVITYNGKPYSVSSIYYDDVDLWFVAQADLKLSLVIVKSPNGITQQYSYAGSPYDLPNINPSELSGFKEPNILVLANGNDLNKNIDSDVQVLFNHSGKRIVPAMTKRDMDDLIQIGVDGKRLIDALSQNEVAFRTYIRNARLQLREMERKQGSNITYQQKMELINNSILQFLLDKNVVNNFDTASKVMASFNIDNLRNAFPGSVNCNMANGLQTYKRELQTLDIILSNYSEMLNRLFSATIVNSQRYIQQCNKDPAIAEHYQSITNSLRNIVSNKDFVNQVCPKPVCPDVVCPAVECKPCPQCPNVETKPIQKPMPVPDRRPMPQPMPQPMPNQTFIDLPVQRNNEQLVFYGSSIGQSGKETSVVNRILYDVRNKEVWFFSHDGQYVKIIVFNLNKKTKRTGAGLIRHNDIGKIIKNDNLILNGVRLSDPISPTGNEGYNVGIEYVGKDVKRPIVGEKQAIEAYLSFYKNILDSVSK